MKSWQALANVFAQRLSNSTYVYNAKSVSRNSHEIQVFLYYTLHRNAEKEDISVRRFDDYSIIFNRRVFRVQ